MHGHQNTQTQSSCGFAFGATGSVSSRLFNGATGLRLHSGPSTCCSTGCAKGNTSAFGCRLQCAASSWGSVAICRTRGRASTRQDATGYRRASNPKTRCRFFGVENGARTSCPFIFSSSLGNSLGPRSNRSGACHVEAKTGTHGRLETTFKRFSGTDYRSSCPVAYAFSVSGSLCTARFNGSDTSCCRLRGRCRCAPGFCTL